MQKLYKSSYFKKSFNIHIFIYILPIIILLIMITTSLNQFLHSEIEDNTKMQLEKSLMTIDDNIGVLNKIASDMYDNETLFMKPRLEETYSRIMINKTLKDYLFINNFYNEIIFYYNNDDELVFTTNDCDKKEIFFDRYYKFVDVDSETLDYWLNEIKVPTLIPVKKVIRYGKINKDVILYIVPLKNREPIATAIFVIDNKWFENTLRSFYEKYEGSVSFYNYEKELITLVHSDKYKVDESSKYIDMELFGNYNNFFMQASISKKVMLRPLYSVYGIILIYVIGLLVFGLFLVLYITRRAYIPIMNLKYLFANEYEQNDDIEAIRLGVEKIKKSNNDLKNSLEEQKQKFESRILKDILNFNQNDVEVNSIFVDKNVVGNKMYQRIVFLLNKSGHSFVDFFNTMEDLNIYVLESDYDDVDIFLVRYPQNIEVELEEKFEEWIKGIETEVNSAVNLIVGKAVDDIFEIRQSFLSAENAYYERIGNTIMFANEEKYMEKFPTEEIIKMEKALNEGRNKDVIEVIDLIEEYVLNSQLHLFMKKCIVYNLYTIFINAAIRLGNDSGEHNAFYAMIDKHRVFETNNFEKIFEELKMQIDAFMKKSEHMKNSELVIRCCDYINNNFFEYVLSVQDIADKLNVTANLLNQQMKREIHMSANEYISYIRLENAKYMLANTQLPISVIVENIGYIDVSSFGRKFKAYTGMSLTQYRKKTRKSEK